MTTVIVRDATEAPQDDITPTVAALAQLTHQIASSDGAGIVVDRPTYEAAEDEMRRRLKARGFTHLPQVQLPQRHFLLFGVPVVCEDD